MPESYQIKSNQTLIISDIHQNLDYFNKVIEIERGNYDNIIFTGDFFDTHKDSPEIATIKDTAKFVRDLCEGEYGKVTLLLGNHDLPYFESWKMNQTYSRKKNLINTCSGYVNNKSLKINKILDISHWNKFQLFCSFGGYLLSHAGFHFKFWDFTKSEHENLNSLWQESQIALANVSNKPHRLFSCGISRGGQMSVGGCCWLDFTDEFEEKDGMPPQIFGHTKQDSPLRKGRSFCLDVQQEVYGILKSNGDLETKSIKTGKKVAIKEWSDYRYNG
jgi:predicted MPP superfamily phosphohydrolase